MRRGDDPHPGTSWLFDPTCTYCGSISPARFLEILRDGEDVSGTDWKYGWPHKFYAGDSHGKFYSVHLLQMNTPAFEELASMIYGVLQITFSFDATERLKYRSPVEGFQTWRGRIGAGLEDPDA